MLDGFAAAARAWIVCEASLPSKKVFHIPPPVPAWLLSYMTVLDGATPSLMLLRVAGGPCVPSRAGVGSVAHACRVAMLLSEYNQRSDGTGFSLGVRWPGWFPWTVFFVYQRICGGLEC